MRRTSDWPFLIACCLLSAILCESASAQKNPNIVLILADDFGVGDIQAHYPDHPIATPNLDALVRSGRSFTDAHSPSGVCSPTRYGLLTGRYAWRTALQEWVLAPYEPPLISDEILTLPKLLNRSGYQTHCIGKWHLGWDWQGPQTPRRLGEDERRDLVRKPWFFDQPIGAGPLGAGFDSFFGVDLPNFPPFTYIRDNYVTIDPTEKLVLPTDQGVVLPKVHEGGATAPNWRFDTIVPRLTDEVCHQIIEAAKQPEPYFMYYSMTSPHEPVSPSKNFAGKSGIAPIADFLMETDWSVGQVLAAIEQTGEAENTIVLFTADNGHSHYTGWEELIAAGHFPSGEFRGHKGDIYEGGHRVPTVIRWPNKIPPNSNSDRLVSLTDIVATFAEVIDYTLTEGDAVDSISFLDAWTDADSGRSNRSDGATDLSPITRNDLISHSNAGEFALRKGPWKLLYRYSERNHKRSRGLPTLVELYHLQDDPSETKNLASQHRDLVQSLTRELEMQIQMGATRPNALGENDVPVHYEFISPVRWAEQQPKDDVLSQMLIGSWQMRDATIDGFPSEIHRSTTTIKHITDTGYLWLGYDAASRLVVRSAGGTWEVHDGAYLETPRYGMAQSFREKGVGEPVASVVYVDDEIMTQKILLENDSTLVEVWERMQPNQEAKGPYYPSKK